MTLEKEVQFGDWDSQITVESVASENRVISTPRVHHGQQRQYFAESRESGGTTIMEIIQHKVREVLPPEYSAQNKVYEYGGPIYDVLCDGRIIFSNEDDTLQILDTEMCQVSLLPTTPGFRYSSFSSSRTSPWVLVVEEDHTCNKASDAKHSIAAINGNTAKVKQVVTGADFYHAPCFSLDGRRLAWLQWNHPDLPFDAAKLYTAEFRDDGTVCNTRIIAGEKATSVAEPRWGYDGSLFFGQEVNGYRQLFRMKPDDDSPAHVKLAGLEEVEFGQVDLIEGSRSYTPLSENTLFAVIAVNGVHKLIVIDLNSLSWQETAQCQNIVQVSLDAVTRLTDSSVLVVGKSTSCVQALYRLDLNQPNHHIIIHKASDEEGFESYYSKPEILCIPSKAQPARKIHGFLWMPYNKHVVVPKSHLPPLIIDAHGGPTWMVGSGLSLKTQYFTSRGYAYVVLNYTGSTGYGQHYRKGLFGNWGIIDTADMAECAQYLASTRRVNNKAIGVSGHSAGGYCVLQCLTTYPDTFAGGVCAAGVSDIQALNETTHKLERYYAESLIGCRDLPCQEQLEKYYERSPIHHTDRIMSPLLMIHGERDTVVPVQQAREIAGALRQRGVDIKLVEVEDERHMLDSAHAIRMWLEEEEAWWRKTLLRSYSDLLVST